MTRIPAFADIAFDARNGGGTTAERGCALADAGRHRGEAGLWA